MRIDRETLLKVVRDTVDRRTRSDRSLLSIYLCGSLLEDDYLLGGTTDIDLVFIHSDEVEQEREIVRLTDEVHLDIAHHFHRDYRQTRRLRVHPWLGPVITKCKVYYDPQHFMDFTQASVRGQFDRPDHVLERSRPQVEAARQIWLDFETRQPDPGALEVLAYLRALGQAANAVALLNGLPLTERRFLLRFPGRAQAAGRPGLVAGLMGLLGAPQVDLETVKSWLSAWQAAYLAIPAEERPARLQPIRRAYYRTAFEAILAGSTPLAALWPLLRTWTLAISLLGEEAPERPAWQAALERLGLLGAAFRERVVALDAYLDTVDETLDEWGHKAGA